MSNIGIQEMLDSLVRVMSTAIDALTPYNANHTRNMVKYGQAFIEWLETTNNEWQFNEKDKQQFIMSIWLHDTGKITVPLEVMDKDSRLGNGLVKVLERFHRISLIYELAFAKNEIKESTLIAKKNECKMASELVLQANKLGPLQNGIVEKINALAELTYVDEDMVKCHFITESERSALVVPKGTLTEKERSIMEQHVVMTEKMLKEISFPKRYSKVLTWASCHHELLDGTGYPHHLKGDEIPKEVRLLTVLDIFDALTARDRPYKSGVSAELAIETLNEMAQQGKLDKAILDTFTKSRVWEN